MPLERVPVALTEEERSMRAREAARFMQLVTEREEQKKEAAREASEEIAALKKQAHESARAANTGVEEREVPVSPRANNERFIVEFFRDDTGDFVRSRPMTDDEMRVARQAVLPLRETQGKTVELRVASGGGTVSSLRGNTRPPIPPASGDKP